MEIGNHLWENVGRFKQKGLKLTTIAIIGGGIASHSLLYAMAKKNISAKILVFYSDSFAFPCSLHSTAIVAPRGVTTGHSPLGDSISSGFTRFQKHVKEDSPSGVTDIPQYTGAITKLESFVKRYPDGKKTRTVGPLKFRDEIYFAEEEGFLVSPAVYLEWLKTEAQRNLSIEFIPSFVTEVKENSLSTVDGHKFSFDEVFITAGVKNLLWQPLFEKETKTRAVQGSYLEFSSDFGPRSFSLTLEGDNLIYHHETNTLLVGSTTEESALELPPEKDLSAILERLKSRMENTLPEFSQGKIKVGLREKAQRREPYILKKESCHILGGLYKNGYTLSLLLSEKLISGYLSAPE